MFRLLRRLKEMRHKESMVECLVRDAAASRPQFVSELHDQTMQSILRRASRDCDVDHGTFVTRSAIDMIIRPKVAYWFVGAVAVCLLVMGTLVVSWETPAIVTSSAENIAKSDKDVAVAVVEPEENWAEAYELTMDEVLDLVGILDAEKWLDREQEIQLAMDDVLDWFLDGESDGLKR